METIIIQTDSDTKKHLMWFLEQLKNDVHVIEPLDPSDTDYLALLDAKKVAKKEYSVDEIANELGIDLSNDT